MKGLIFSLLFLIPYTLSSQELKVKECFTDTINSKNYCIASDTITYDTVFGDCYRLFTIYDLKSKNTKKIYLNINLSADFPYYMNVNFISNYSLLIIQGIAEFYLFNPTINKISKQVFPDYKNCEFSDMQGTYIRNLKIVNDGKILELDVNECGLHRFNIQNLDEIYEIE